MDKLRRERDSLGQRNRLLQISLRNWHKPEGAKPNASGQKVEIRYKRKSKKLKHTFSATLPSSFDPETMVEVFSGLYKQSMNAVESKEDPPLENSGPSHHFEAEDAKINESSSPTLPKVRKERVEFRLKPGSVRSGISGSLICFMGDREHRLFP